MNQSSASASTSTGHAHGDDRDDVDLMYGGDQSDESELEITEEEPGFTTEDATETDESSYGNLSSERYFIQICKNPQVDLAWVFLNLHKRNCCLHEINWCTEKQSYSLV